MIVAVTQQSMWNVMEPLTEEKKQLVMNFAITLKEPETNTEDRIIDIADQAAAATSVRLTHDEVFGDIRRAVDAGR